MLCVLTGSWAGAACFPRGWCWVPWCNQIVGTEVLLMPGKEIAGWDAVRLAAGLGMVRWEMLGELKVHRKSITWCEQGKWPCHATSMWWQLACFSHGFRKGGAFSLDLTYVVLAVQSPVLLSDTAPVCCCSPPAPLAVWQLQKCAWVCLPLFNPGCACFLPSPARREQVLLFCDPAHAVLHSGHTKSRKGLQIC